MIDLPSLYPCQLLQGIGSRNNLASFISNRAKVLVVTTSGMLRRKTLAPIVHTWRFERVIYCTVTSNPELDELDALLSRCRQADIDLIVGVGGGSVIDSAKVLAVMMDSENDDLSLSDVLRKGVEFINKRLPVFVVPTTSGTGAEVTPFATVWDKREGKKRSFAHDVIVPDLVCLDPELTRSLPLEITINCALDCCSHAMETLWNKHATTKSLDMAQESLRLFLEALPVLVNDLGNLEARTKQQLASTLSGLAIAINRTAIAHSISYPITLHFNVPHGLACSFSLPRIARYVNQCDAWPTNVEKHLVESVLLLLKKIDVESRIKQYCSLDDIRTLTDKMFTPGRGDNFIVPRIDLNEILK